MLSRSLACPKCIPQQSSACFEFEIPSGWHIGLGCATTSPMSCEPRPFCAMSFRPPLSSCPSRFLCSLDPIVGQRLPKSHDWMTQTALQELFREGSRPGFLTASHPYHLGQGKNWHPLRHHVVWEWICRTPHWKDRRNLSAFPPVDATSRLCPVTKMYYWSPFRRSGNHWNVD